MPEIGGGLEWAGMAGECGCNSIYKILHFRRMSGVSVDVKVTVWWEDVGGKDERKLIIPLACPAIRGHPRPDELLATKLKEKIPFARWLRLEVQVDNKWTLGRQDLVYDQSHDEVRYKTQ